MGNYIGETIGDDEGKYIGCFSHWHNKTNTQ